MRSKAGLDHKHCGSLHAADPQMAIQLARDVYTRRQEGTSVWVVRSDQIIASDPGDKAAYFDPMADKVYRHPTFYELPEVARPHVRRARMTASFDPRLAEPSVQYLLRLGDTCLILAQRLGEWCGHAPMLEEDIALTNMALDLLGQARAVLTRAGALEAELGGTPHDEDQLAFLRDERDFRNCTLVELPRGDFALDDAAQLRDGDLPRAALAAARALERRRARGDRRQGGQGGALSPASTPPTGSCASATAPPNRRAHAGRARLALAVHGRDVRGRRRSTSSRRAPASARAGPTCASLACRFDTVARRGRRSTPPAERAFRSTGKLGRHSEHLGYILAEMQHLQRAYPGGVW